LSEPLGNASSQESRGIIPEVSVVIVAKDSYDMSPCVASLEKQVGLTTYEIIVVRGGNRSQGRNEGINRSKGALTAFIDADSEAPEDWLKKLVSAIRKEDSSVAGVGGVSDSEEDDPSPLQLPIDAVFSTFIGSLNSPSLLSRPRYVTSFVRSLSTHNCIYRKQALLEVGGLDASYVLNEDTDLSARLRAVGYKLVLDESIFVYHHRRQSFKDFKTQFFQYGVSRMRSMLTSSKLVDFRVLVFFSLFILFLVWAAVVVWSRPVFVLLAILSYFAVIIASSALTKVSSIKILPSMIALFIVEHLSYAVGLLLGVFLGPWRRDKEDRASLRVEERLLTFPPAQSRVESVTSQ
jgi:GT2 family glycosyltransferase